MTQASPLPIAALSVRQPWAWAIIHGGKDIENRSWREPNPGLRFRGPVCIHASKGMTRDEYEDARETIEHLGGTCPAPADLLRGGIIGVATIGAIVKESSSGWFFGPRGLVLTDQHPVEFIPSGGALGFFNWKHMDADLVPGPAKWMQTWGQDAPAPMQTELLGPLQPISPLERQKRRALGREV